MDSFGRYGLFIFLHSATLGCSGRFLLRTTLQVTGISATSGTLKGGEDTELTGDIIVVDVGRNSFQRLTNNGGYRSPVFEPGDKALLALKGDTLVRVVMDGGKEEVLYSKIGVSP
jgi:hypothetical protein